MLVDVGPAMHSVLPDVEKTCSLLMQKKVNQIHFPFLLKLLLFFFVGSNRALSSGYCLLLQIIYNKFDEVGIVVFGTQGLSLHKC